MLQHFRVVRQVGMDDEAQIGKIEAARRNVGRHANARAPIAQRLQRMIALALAEFARQRHRRETALQQDRFQMAHRVSRGAEHQRIGRIHEAQQIDDRAFRFVVRHADGAIFDIGMAFARAHRFDAQRVALIVLRQIDDGLGQGRREQQGAAFRRRRFQNELEIFPEAHVEHLVRFIQHDDFQRRNLQRAPLQMVTQAPRCADHDMHAILKLAAFAAGVHAAHAGHRARARILIKPVQFALHLQRQLARRCDDERKRLARRSQRAGAFQQRLRHRDAIGHGLAGAGLRGNQKIALFRIGLHHGGLHRRGFFIIALCEGAGDGGRCLAESQNGTFGKRRLMARLSLSRLNGKDSKRVKAPRRRVRLSNTGRSTHPPLR